MISSVGSVGRLKSFGNRTVLLLRSGLTAHRKKGEKKKRVVLRGALI
jgi:hypothetical protein